MRVLLMVSDQLLRSMVSALGQWNGGAEVHIVHHIEEIRVATDAYDLAIIEVYHGDPDDVPRRIAGGTVGLDAIRFVNGAHPSCAILAGTHSRIEGDAHLAEIAGADWVQSFDWTHDAFLASILPGQIEHALEHRTRKRVA